ncbi:MAG: Eco57I restriction-modification methylase domain-containing protein [Gammaproteobacteria bacterium]
MNRHLTLPVEASHPAAMNKPLDNRAVIAPKRDTGRPLVDAVEALRITANAGLDADQRGKLGQFMTPSPVAQLMAAMFDDLSGDIHLLDAGAGVGSLTTAFIEVATTRKLRPAAITANAYELEPLLLPLLEQTKTLCKNACDIAGIPFSAKVFPGDFIEEATTMLRGDLFAERIQPRFNRAILNPPYHKINSSSKTRLLLRSVGIETSNLYTAFVALAVRLLEDNGELVAITPRSFCNGPYFKPFRELLLGSMTLKHIHIFHARNKAFKDNQVLQENVILHAVKAKTTGRVLISSSTCANDPNIERRWVDQHEVVNPEDPDLFIHIAAQAEDNVTALNARSLPCSLADIGIQVSTGRVVDFRAMEFLKMKPGRSTVPLIYPGHFEHGFVAWPKLEGRKPNAITDNAATANLMVPNETYVLVKRFSSKEERRRVVAAIYDPQRIKAAHVGFENHLNYFHSNGSGLAMNVAKGLAVFLNSTIVDRYFRQFSGHTQVNATDLRSLRYPSIEQLKRLGSRVRNKMSTQERIDALIEQTLFS